MGECEHGFTRNGLCCDCGEQAYTCDEDGVPLAEHRCVAVSFRDRISALESKCAMYAASLRKSDAENASLARDLADARNPGREIARLVGEVAKRDEQIATITRERDELRVIKPNLPPMPPNGSGMPRYGLRWNGPDEPLAVPMIDGYWTPWHLADADRDSLRAKLGTLEFELMRSNDSVLRRRWSPRSGASG